MEIEEIIMPPLEEAPVEEPPVPEAEEPAPVEEAPQEQPQEEENAPSPLIEAIHLLASASDEDIAALPEEAKKEYGAFVSKQINAGILADLSWLKRAMQTLANGLQKSAEDSEEFRVLSKTTLQKNVQILEEQVKFNQFNKILKAISNLYCTYAFLLDAEGIDPKTMSNIEGIFEELEALLEDYGAVKVSAKVGDDFDPIASKIAKRIPTDDPALDKKVAAVRSPGFRKDKLILTPLRADMYVYEPKAE